MGAQVTTKILTTFACIAGLAVLLSLMAWIGTSINYNRTMERQCTAVGGTWGYLRNATSGGKTCFTLDYKAVAMPQVQKR
jgi:hypothetical protein